jgi:hypothetical protein
VRSLTKVFQDSPAVQTPPRLLRQLNMLTDAAACLLTFGAAAADSVRITESGVRHVRFLRLRQAQ